MRLHNNIFFVRVTLMFILITLGCGTSSKSEKIDSKQKDTKSTNFFFGYLDAISLESNSIVFRVPNEWVSDEYRFGKLYSFNVKTLKRKEIADTIIIEYPKSTFISKDLLAIPAQSRIYFYDLGKDKVGETFGQVDDEDQYIMEFSVDPRKAYAAFLILDFNEINVKLELINIKSKEKKTVLHSYDYENPSYVTGGVFWVDDKLYYSIQGKLFEYNMSSGSLKELTDNLSFYNTPLYTVSEQEVVFFEGNTFKNIVYRYSVKDGKIESIELDKFDLVSPPRRVNLFSSNIMGEEKVFLAVDNKYYKLKGKKFEKIDSLVLFISDSLEVRESFQDGKPKLQFTVVN